jgi:hypothetical protein
MWKYKREKISNSSYWFFRRKGEKGLLLSSLICLFFYKKNTSTLYQIKYPCLTPLRGIGTIGRHLMIFRAIPQLCSGRAEYSMRRVLPGLALIWEEEKRSPRPTVIRYHVRTLFGANLKNRLVHKHIVMN